MMNTFKLNVMNSLVVTGLVAASMVMPFVAAELAQASTQNDATPTSVQNIEADTIR